MRPTHRLAGCSRAAPISSSCWPSLGGAGASASASFESRGLFACDMDGTLVWEKDLGDKLMRNQFGEGSTPVLYGDRLVIVWDHIGGQSVIPAPHKNTGRGLWRAGPGETQTPAAP